MSDEQSFAGDFGKFSVKHESTNRGALTKSPIANIRGMRYEPVLPTKIR